MAFESSPFFFFFFPSKAAYARPVANGAGGVVGMAGALVEEEEKVGVLVGKAPVPVGNGGGGAAAVDSGGVLVPVLGNGGGNELVLVLLPLPKEGLACLC